MEEDQDSCGRSADLHSAVRTRKLEDRRSKTAKNSMNAGPCSIQRWPLHNFRVTGLCTACTPLTNKKLQLHEFH